VLVETFILFCDCSTPCLQDLFAKFGELRDVYRPNDYYTQAPKRFAFVEYLNSAHATKAREDLDGTTQFGEPMSIQEAKHGRKNKDDMRAR
jgi:RNA recognition motif-containing protein